MMKMMRRMAAMLCALFMLLTAAHAEETDFVDMLPLMDLTASAALRVGETPENITAEGMLSQAFVYNFFLLGQSADASLGVTAEMLSDADAQRAYLTKAFSASQMETGGMEILVAELEEYRYVGVQPMASQMNDAGDEIILYGDLYQAEGPIGSLSEEQYMQLSWLNWRVVAQMHRDANAPGGWKIHSLTFEPAVSLDDNGQSDTTLTMVEYVNTELGFSIQYPAVFSESALQESEGGISGALSDGSASFSVGRKTNDEGLTLEQYTDMLAQAYDGAAYSVNEISMTGQVIHQRADGMTQVDVVLVTDSWVYEAQLCYAPELAEAFALYSDYMTNSFMADELGIG